MPPASGEDAALHELRRAIVGALEDAASTRQFENPNIRAAVAAYAEAVRVAGRPPEWLIVDLKKLIAHDALPDLRDWFRSVLRDRLVTWGISGYFQLPHE
jgi:hypothetical protein